MAEPSEDQTQGSAQLGGKPEGRIQRYFCMDDEKYHAFARVSKDATVLRRIPKRIRVMGKDVDGWVVEVMVPATDGVVRVDPLEGADKI